MNVLDVVLAFLMTSCLKDIIYSEIFADNLHGTMTVITDSQNQTSK